MPGFLNSSETGKGQCATRQYLSSNTESSEQVERELGQGKCPARKGRCTSTHEAETLRHGIHPKVEKSVMSTKCRWGCCYTEEKAAPTVHVFCRKQTPRNCSRPAAVRESCLETSLDFLNGYCRMNGEVLKVMRNMVAWQEVTKPLYLGVLSACVLLSWKRNVVTETPLC